MKRVSHSSTLFLLGAMLSILPRVLEAQVSDTVLGTRLLAHPILRAPFADTLRLDLHRHGQYRIAVWPATTGLSIAPSRHGDRPEFTPRVKPGTTSEPAIFELAAQTDGSHQFVVTPPTGAQVVRLWIWEDSTAEIASEARKERRWNLGLAATGGIVAGYQIPADVGVARKASHYVEGGLVIGSGSTLSFVFGFGNDPRPAADTLSINWAFAEARARLFHWEVAGHTLGVSGVVREALGNSSDFVAEDPHLLSFGALMTVHLDHRREFRGLSLGLQGMYGTMTNLDIANQDIWRISTSHHLGALSHRAHFLRLTSSAHRLDAEVSSTLIRHRHVRGRPLQPMTATLPPAEVLSSPGRREAMFDALIESRRARERTLAQTIASVVIHTLIFAVAIQLTRAAAQAARSHPAEVEIAFASERTPPPPPAARMQSQSPLPSASVPVSLNLVPPVNIPTTLPSVNAEPAFDPRRYTGSPSRERRTSRARGQLTPSIVPSPGKKSTRPRNTWEARHRASLPHSARPGSRDRCCCNSWWGRTARRSPDRFTSSRAPTGHSRKRRVPRLSVGRSDQGRFADAAYDRWSSNRCDSS